MRTRDSVVVVGLWTLVVACGGGSGSELSPSSAASAEPTIVVTTDPIEPTTVPTPPTDPPAPTDLPTTTEPPETSAPTPEESSVLYGGGTLAPGEAGLLAYMSLDSTISVTAPDDLQVFSLTGSGGTGWVNFVANDATGPQLMIAANSLTVNHTEDPLFTGQGDSPLLPVPDSLVEWIAARSFLASAESGTVELGTFEGTFVDYEIGDLAEVGYPCPEVAHAGKSCVSMLLFGSYLRGFPAGESGTVYDVSDGSTRLIVVTFDSDGDELASTLSSTPRTPSVNSIGPAIAGGGALSASASYAVPDVLDGLDVGFTVGGAGAFARLEPGWLGIYESAQAPTAQLAVFRGSLMHWNNDPAFDPSFPFSAEVLANAPAVELATVPERLAATGFVVADGPTETSVGGYPALRFTLIHAGPGLDRCNAPCIAAMFSSAGRTPLVEEGTPRTFVVVDVDGQPLVLAVVGDGGEALLASVTINPA